MLNIRVLDACRNNPFASSGNRGIGGTRGLAAVYPPKGMFILYSADACEAVLDRMSDDDDNPNSVFTRTLVPMLQRPQMNLPEIAREVRKSVSKLAKTVSHSQTPAYYDAMFGDFDFSGIVAVGQSNTNITVLGSTSATTDQIERGFWAAVETSPSRDMYDAYLSQYSNGYFAAIAKIKIEKAQAGQFGLAKLIVRANQRGDQVRINGEEKGSTKLDLALAPGDYQIEVIKDGYQRFEKTATLAAGKERTIYANLTVETSPKVVSSQRTERESELQKVLVAEQDKQRIVLMK